MREKYVGVLFRVWAKLVDSSQGWIKTLDTKVDVSRGHFHFDATFGVAHKLTTLRVDFLKNNWGGWKILMYQIMYGYCNYWMIA